MRRLAGGPFASAGQIIPTLIRLSSKKIAVNQLLGRIELLSSLACKGKALTPGLVDFGVNLLRHSKDLVRKCAIGLLIELRDTMPERMAGVLRGLPEEQQLEFNKRVK